MGQLTLRVITTITPAANALAFSPDGQRLAIASDDGKTGTVGIHSLPDGAALATLNSNILFSRVGFGPDGTIAAATGRVPGGPGVGSVVVFNPSTGAQLWRVDGQPDTRVVFSPDGHNVVLFEQLIVPSHGGAVRMCEARTGAQKWRFDVAPPNTLYSAAISFDGAVVAAGVGGKDKSTGEIVLLDAASGAQRKQVPMPAHVRAVSFSAKTAKLLFGADNQIGILDPDAGDALRVLPDGGGIVTGRAVTIWVSSSSRILSIR